jgi:hypothetical protein
MARVSVPAREACPREQEADKASPKLQTKPRRACDARLKWQRTARGDFMRRNLLCVVVLSAAISLAGCSGLSDVKSNSGGNGTGGAGNNQGSTVQISPMTASVSVFTTQPFTATVAGSSNQAVVWQVNGVTGGTEATGYISSTGVYVAPSAVPAISNGAGDSMTTTVTVTAVSQANSTATASATVTVTAPNQKAQSGAVLLGSSGGNISDANNGFCCGGTLGSLVSLNGTTYILSNNHVLARSDNGLAGDSISQPGLIDVPSPNTCTAVGTETVAHLSQFYNLQTGPLPRIDAALAQIVTGQVDAGGNILLLGATATNGVPDAGAPHSGTGVAAAPAQAVAKSGRTTALTCSTVLGTNISASVDYYLHCGDATKAFTVTYTDLVSVTGGNFSVSGDSGSLIVTQTTADPVALLFAGSDTDSVGNPISDVLNAFPGAGNATPTFVGGAAHPVIGCTLPTQPQSAIAPRPQVAAEVMRAAAMAKDLHAPELLANGSIYAIGLGESYDHPGKGAILIFVKSGTLLTAVPKAIDGIRTRVIEGEVWPFRGLLSAEETMQMMRGVAQPQMVYPLSASEMARAKTVHDARTADLLKNPDVVGVGITSSVDSPTEAALLIYVKRGAVSQDSLPFEIDGLRTRIRETGPFLAGKDGNSVTGREGCRVRSLLKEPEGSGKL